MTPSEREEIRQRCEAATPWPWSARRSNKSVDGGFDYGIAADWSTPSIIAEAFERTSFTRKEPSFENATFIAHARRDVPALLSELDRMERERAELVEAVDAVLASYDSADVQESLESIDRSAMKALRAARSLAGRK